MDPNINLLDNEMVIDVNIMDVTIYHGRTMHPCAPIVSLISANVVEHGIGVRLVYGGKTINSTEFFEHEVVNAIWMPISKKLVEMGQLVGFGVLIIPKRNDRKHPVPYVPHHSQVLVKWGFQDGEAVYTAHWRNRTLAKSRIENAMIFWQETPVLGRVNGVNIGLVSSPTRRSLSLAHNFLRNMQNLTMAIESQAYPIMAITDTPSKASTSKHVDRYDFTWSNAETLSGKVTAPVNADSEVMQKYADSRSKLERFGDNAKPKKAGGFLDVVPGRPTLAVPPGKQLSGVATASLSTAAVALNDDILGAIAREYGLTKEILHGRTSSVVAGIETARKQLAVRIRAIQAPLAEFLSDAMIEYYKDDIIDLLSNGKISKRKTKKDKKAKAKKRTKKEKIKSDGGEEGSSPSNGSKSGSESESGSGSGSGSEGDMLGVDANSQRKNRVEVVFHGAPYLTFDDLERMHASGIVSSKAFVERSLNIYGLQSREAMANGVSDERVRANLDKMAGIVPGSKKRTRDEGSEDEPPRKKKRTQDTPNGGATKKGSKAPTSNKGPTSAHAKTVANSKKTNGKARAEVATR